MNVIETGIEELFIIEPKVFKDPRGYFFESYHERVFKERNINSNFVQDNQSKSTYGVLRGLHYQLEPFSQAKLVRVLQGSVLDVAVDIRRGSKTYKQWHAVELSGDNKRQMYIPRGFAHGFLVLSETAEFFYKCDNFYSKEHEAGVRFDDPELNIDWQIDPEKILLSEKDRQLPFFKDAQKILV